MTVSIVLNLPDDVYRALVVPATRHGVQVHTLLEKALTKQVRQPARRAWRKFTDAEIERVRELNAQGWSDNRIATDLGRNQSSVSERRRALGLESPTPLNPGAGRSRRAA